MPPHIVGSERARYVETLRKLGEFYSSDGIIDSNGVINVYQSMRAAEALPLEQEIDTTMFFDNSFVLRQSQAQPTSLEMPFDSAPGRIRIDWPNVAAGALLGALISGVVVLVRWLLTHTKRDKERQEALDARAKAENDLLRIQDKLIVAENGRQSSARKLEAIERELTKREEEFRERHGFVPLRTGLEAFEERICQRAKAAKNSVKLCFSTPLLYSLKATPWYPYNRHHLNQKHTDYWPNHFCEQFRGVLREHLRDNKLLNLDLVFLDDKSAETLLQALNPAVPYGEHKASLDFFLNEVLMKDEGTNVVLCKMSTHRVMRVPFYLALFDTEDKTACHGIVAFTNDNYLLNKKESAATMAQTLQAYEFTNCDVVCFLNHMFEQTKLLSDKNLVDFMEICIASGFSWSVIANGVPKSGTLLPEPHATLFHLERQ